MFVVSFKASKRQLVSMIVCVIMLIAVILVAILWPLGSASAQTYVPVTGSNDSERVAFLTKLGYEIDSQSPEVKEVLIPDEFDNVFQKYNAVQKQAGMDLQPYHGKRVKVWTYKVLNVPDSADVYANLYVYKDKIIGGDISSTALEGFMHGLVQNSNDERVTANAPTATTAGGKVSGTTAKATTKTTAQNKTTAKPGTTQTTTTAKKATATTKATAR